MMLTAQWQIHRRHGEYSPQVPQASDSDAAPGGGARDSTTRANP